MKLKKNEQYLFVTDLDGTFLASADASMNIANYIAVKKVKESGNLFAIATGRSWWWTKMTYEQLELDGPSIQFHGAHVHHPHDKNFDGYANLIPAEWAKEILKKNDIPSRAVKVQWFGLNKHAEIIETEDLKYIDYDAGEVTIYVKHNTVSDEEVEKMNKDFGDKIIVRKFISGQDGTLDFLAISAPKTNKGTALEHIAKYYNIPRERVIYFGDNINDLEAIEYAGISVAPSNAKDFVKEKVDIVLEKSNKEGAIGREIIRMIDEAE